MNPQTVSFHCFHLFSNYFIILTKTETYVNKIDLYITEEYINGTYNSCKNVQYPSTGQLALDLMCGEWGAAKCSPINWYNFMGDETKQVVPFQIDYKIQNSTEKVNGFYPLNPRVVPCSESVDVS
jgi:Niemann-Pick C1 protein